MQLAGKVGDAKFDSVLARIKSHRKLRLLPDVTNADNIPGGPGRLPRPESANERKLLRQSLREDVPVIFVFLMK